MQIWHLLTVMNSANPARVMELMLMTGIKHCLDSLRFDDSKYKEVKTCLMMRIIFVTAQRSLT